MSNQRLRSALANKGLTQAMLAEQVGVDAKSVERWITQERMPHATTRAAVANALSQDETYLWPALLGTRQSRDATESELVQVWPTRNEVPGEVWRSLLRQATDQVDILMYAGSFLFEAYDLVETVRAKAEAGTNFRILVGDGRCEAVHLRQREEGRPAIGDRCRSSLEYLSAIAGVNGVQIRKHQTTLYVSVFRFDDSMLINNHTYGSFASHSPVMHLRRVPGGQLYDFYARSVDRVWATGEPVA
jgi:transcriptional regulator with XRE-family HTH domain